MPTILNIETGRASPRLHVDTLVRLRWLALSGQAAALLFTYFVLGFAFPFAVGLLIIAISAWLNVALRLRYGQVDRLNEKPGAVILGYDILQLTALLYLTGGIENPFSMLFLAPIMVSAVSLSVWTTMALTGLTIAAVTFLTIAHYPLPWWPGQRFELPLIYALGLWTAHVVSATFIAIYATMVALEGRKLADALAATELILAREQHLTQLDGLAAAAAHELGTPLATVTLVARDLQKQIKSGPMADDVALLSQEVARCRTILGKLTSLGDEGGDILDDLSLCLLLEEVVAPHRDFGVKITVIKDGEEPQPMTRRNPAILYGLGNLIENAVDFAVSETRIHARWTASTVKIVIEDDGPGFSPEVAGRIGAPYVTTKTDRRAKSEEGAGLGLGLFIAKTLLERSGATVMTSNLAPPKHGARITVVWQRAAFERGVKSPRALVAARA